MDNLELADWLEENFGGYHAAEWTWQVPSSRLGPAYAGKPVAERPFPMFDLHRAFNEGQDLIAAVAALHPIHAMLPLPIGAAGDEMLLRGDKQARTALWNRIRMEVFERSTGNDKFDPGLQAGLALLNLFLEITGSGPSHGAFLGTFEPALSAAVLTGTDPAEYAAAWAKRTVELLRRYPEGPPHASGRPKKPPPEALLLPPQD